jgi:hypothetical protein
MKCMSQNAVADHLNKNERVETFTKGKVKVRIRNLKKTKKTLDAFHDAPDELLKDASSLTLTRDDNAAITTAVIGTIGDLDGSELSAHEAGISRFFSIEK